MRSNTLKRDNIQQSDYRSTTLNLKDHITVRHNEIKKHDKTTTNSYSCSQPNSDLEIFDNESEDFPFSREWL